MYMALRQAALSCLAAALAVACAEAPQTDSLRTARELALNVVDEGAIEVALVGKQKQFLSAVAADDRDGLAALLDPQFRWGVGSHMTVDMASGRMDVDLAPPEADYLRMMAGFTPIGFVADNATFRVRWIQVDIASVSAGPNHANETLVTTWRRDGLDWRATAAGVLRSQRDD